MYNYNIQYCVYGLQLIKNLVFLARVFNEMDGVCAPSPGTGGSCNAQEEASQSTALDSAAAARSHLVSFLRQVNRVASFELVTHPTEFSRVCAHMPVLVHSTHE